MSVENRSLFSKLTIAAAVALLLPALAACDGEETAGTGEPAPPVQQGADPNAPAPAVPPPAAD